MNSHATTLDNAQLTYNPFTECDIWGAPSSVSLVPELQKELPLGGDDSALPGMAEHYLRNGEPIPGSDHTPLWKRADVDREQEMQMNVIYLAAFAAILGAAFWYRLPQ